MPCEGLVVAHGPGRVHPLTGTLIPMCVADGDTVLFSRWSGRKVGWAGGVGEHVMQSIQFAAVDGSGGGGRGACGPDERLFGSSRASGAALGKKGHTRKPLWKCRVCHVMKWFLVQNSHVCGSAEYAMR